MKKWRIIARHKDFYPNTTVVESFLISDSRIRRFTATIDGFQNWKLYEGRIVNSTETIKKLQEKIRDIEDKIRSGDDSVFFKKDL